MDLKFNRLASLLVVTRQQHVSRRNARRVRVVARGRGARREVATISDDDARHGARGVVLR